MQLTLNCKRCDADTDASLDQLAQGVRCGGCDLAIDADLGGAIAESVSALAGHLAEARATFRFEVLLETDDLPAPHGFDEDYVLPEERSEDAPSSDSM